MKIPCTLVHQDSSEAHHLSKIVDVTLDLIYHRTSWFLGGWPSPKVSFTQYWTWMGFCSSTGVFPSVQTSGILASNLAERIDLIATVAFATSFARRSPSLRFHLAFKAWRGSTTQLARLAGTLRLPKTTVCYRPHSLLHCNTTELTCPSSHHKVRPPI